jgi:hypothetical protein
MSNYYSTINNILSPLKKRIGLEEPDESEDKLYERGKKIVPDCIETYPNEIPVKQYDIAILETKLTGMRAEGRLQVTNQRVIFRAAGSSLLGKTLIQHSFALSEVGGVETRRDVQLGIANIIIGLLSALVVGGVFALFSRLIYGSSAVGGVVFALFLGIVGLMPFFMVKKQFFIKLLCCGASLGSLLGAYLVMSTLSGRWGSTGSGFNVAQLSPVIAIFMVISGLLGVVALILSAIRPNFVFVIKTKGAAGVVEIRRKSLKEEYTGYEEVLPGKDADKAVREINAMIHDITSTVGGIDKWIEKNSSNLST